MKRAVNMMRDPQTEHPVLTPARLVFGQLGIPVEPVAVIIMASGVRYLDPVKSLPDAFGGFDGAFDLFEAAGFNCEQFRSTNAQVFLDAARRQFALSEHRWKPTPLYSYYPELDKKSGRTVVLPVGLREFTKSSVRVTSALADRTLSYGDYLRADFSLWGYAAPVPSLGAIITPGRYSFSSRAQRSLRLMLQRMRVGSDGLSLLDGFLAGQPMRSELDRYRRKLDILCGGDPTFFRATLTEAIDLYGAAFVGEAARDGFERSAELHAAFLAGDDRALAEIARTERAALENQAVRLPGGTSYET